MCSMDGPRYSPSCQPDMPEGTWLRCRRQRTGHEVALGIGKAHGQKDRTIDKTWISGFRSAPAPAEPADGIAPRAG